MLFPRVLNCCKDGYISIYHYLSVFISIYKYYSFHAFISPHLNLQVVCKRPIYFVFIFVLKMIVYFPSISFVFSLNLRTILNLPFLYFTLLRKRFFFISLNDPSCLFFVRFFKRKLRSFSKILFIHTLYSYYG